MDTMFITGSAGQNPSLTAVDGSVSSITALTPGKLFALHNTMELDGRVAAFPQAARGHASVNCYLLLEDDQAMLIDTGFAVHREAILAQIKQLLPSHANLTLFPLRMNEFMSLSNVIAISKNFSVDYCVSTLSDASYHVDLESISQHDIVETAAGLKTMLISGTETLSIGSKKERKVKLFQAPIRLIATRWIYDQTTRTLFTSDMFTGHWDPDSRSSWIVDESNDHSTIENLCTHLLSTRYWWLEGAQTDSLRQKLADLVAKCDIETIAPGYGKILRGRSVVNRHLAMLDEALHRLDRSQNPPRYIGRDERISA
jgi:hypothetical protein